MPTNTIIRPQCRVEGCTNLAANMGYERYRKKCERHRYQEEKSKPPRPYCAIEKCNRPSKSAGYGRYHKYCFTHHAMKYGMRVDNDGRVIPFEFANISNIPCRMCKKKNIPTDKHRVVPGKLGGKYSIENVIFLCRSCHLRLHHINRQLFALLKLQKGGLLGKSG